MPPLPLRHVDPRWLLDEDREWLRRLGRERTLLQYDPRGLGLSDRVVGPYAPDALVDDLEAVVDRSGAERVALLALTNTGPIAIEYALRHPERVSHMILWCASARGSDCMDPQIEALLGVAEKDWPLFTEAVGHVVRGWSGGEAARRFAAFLRECTTPETAQAVLGAAGRLDVGPRLAQVCAPTLTVHRRELTSVRVELARELASGIPDAHLLVLDGAMLPPSMGDVHAAERAVDEFLGDRVTAPPSGSVSTLAVGESVFRHEGEYWTLAFAGTLCRVRDCHGLHHIADLLRRPGRDVSAGDLLGGSLPATSGNLAANLGDGELRAASLGDAGPVLDAEAKTAYRLRLAQLRAELEEASGFNDTGRAERARAEIDALTDQLASAVGLGGRDRRVASAQERARLTVTKRIKDAVERIRRSHPALATHLDASIRTGQHCEYRPDPLAPIAWVL